jgi:photosystem II stability/assembly factor-like uncharacterized protein
MGKAYSPWGFAMRLLALGFIAVACNAADWTLYVTAATTKNYVVGAKLLPSGLFARKAAAEWQLLGHPNPFTFALDYDPRDPAVVYLAAGNGLIRVRRGNSTWKILTAEDITEVRDVSLDATGAIYFSHSAGVRVSRDKGATWQELGATLPRKYCDAIRADRGKTGTIIVGCEDGLWRSTDGGKQWIRAGASGLQVMRLEQSPHDPCVWMAGTQQGGLFASQDCAKTFENLGHLGVGRNVYDIAFDPTTPKRLAVAGWGIGIAVSEDSGKTWVMRDRSLPSSDIWSIAFDPGKAGRLFASVHEDAVYMSEDAGATWRREGLEGSIVNRMKFLPEVRK